MAGARSAGLTGRRVRMLWPDGSGVTDASGLITHVSWYEDETRPPGCEVLWDADWSGKRGALVPRESPRSTWVPDITWLAAEDGQPLEVFARVELAAVAGGLL